LKFTPATNFAGGATLSIDVNDQGNTGPTGSPVIAKSDSKSISIVVTANVDAPVAVNDSFTVAEGSALSGNVLRNDCDADGDALTVTVASATVRSTTPRQRTTSAPIHSPTR